ncbi:hypothetical protein QA601_05735 [Chitinispirillales bacterium ANBcel5]|uniref:hypothetical protein n=1 Tax=Cellulosispirillum alkaliphilum TaxID=3039283 RepID=UPI002A53B1F7|nr:hypothetical protein [Chitinispirillales bacterium ANBcel5]
MVRRVFCCITVLFLCISGEPVVLNGEMVPELLGEPLGSIRVVRRDGRALPFQIDEVTEEGEYVLPQGEYPNSDEGSGYLKKRDEIVFLWDDTDRGGNTSPKIENAVEVSIRRAGEKREVFLLSDSQIPLSERRYIEYEHDSGLLRTPFYYAQFAEERFHFTRAGVRDFETGTYIDLTNELRVDILFRALWGLLPIRYTEDNIICYVRRYKVGPVRLIRRGDFSLNLGLGVRGSRAAVNQICYPSKVKVPVYVHVPFRFRSFFSHAHIEMTPVMNKDGEQFAFSVPSHDIRQEFGGEKDTLWEVIPDNTLFSVKKGDKGYGWLLQTTMDKSLLSGSGFVFRTPSEREGIGESGYRLGVRNVRRGYYHITNWVIFSTGSAQSINKGHRALVEPAEIRNGKTGFQSRLNALDPIISIMQEE